MQVRTGGVWSDVAGLVSTPAYAGANGITYEQFALQFTPTTGDAIRIAGTPGGAARFVSVGELRVLVGAPATASVVLGSPNGGETLTAGSTKAITWTASGMTSVDLAYRTSPTGAWVPIAGGVSAGSGSYAWTVPATATTQARVRIAQTGNSSVSDISAGDFAILSGAQDITAHGTPIALITAPSGGGNWSLDVIRDGVFPAVGTTNSAQQYDTYTGDPTRSFDWIGYQFGASQTFTGLTLQEGKQFSNGGWFTALRVQVRSGGMWTDVGGLVSTPAYAGANGITYEQFALQFTPTTGDAIRIAGTPGGAARFISVGELRVLASAP